MTDLITDVFAPIPAGAPHLIGINAGDGRVHAVRRKAALHAAALEDRDHCAPRARVPAACGFTVIVDRGRGVFRRGNAALDRNAYRLCPYCAWTVALADGSTEAELAAITPAGADLAALQRLMTDPTLAVRICRHLLTTIAVEEDGWRPEYWAQLLAHATEHRPALLVCGDCAEGGCDHDDGGCQEASDTAACAACSIQAGGWAGEWEGQYECIVPAPCGVLPAMAAHYGVPAAAEREDAAR